MMTYNPGYDYFTPAPGAQRNMQCNACGHDMDVKRDSKTSQGFAHAMAVRTANSELSKCDVFTCPNSGKSWHDQVIDLMRERAGTASHQIAHMLGEEIKTIVQTKMASRTRYRDREDSQTASEIH